jgi:small subunit ribosomal protein S4
LAAIFGDDKAFERRSYPPGQHGMAKKERKNLNIQLMEKQKAKYSYGILEAIQRFIQKASATKGVTEVFYNYAKLD